jgi:hypothetical protein
MESIHISEPLDKDLEIGDPVRVKLAEETSSATLKTEEKQNPRLNLTTTIRMIM